jgi:hypothetical protein
VTPLERRCRWLLLAYPACYRRERAGEMLGTLLEASAPGRRWPSFRDARALVAGVICPELSGQRVYGLAHAAGCRFRYSSRTCFGVRY